MIAANELRIGNCVKCKTSNDAKVYRVLALDGYNLKIMLNDVRQGEWQSEERVKPIKITPQVLLKSGFTRDFEPDDYVGYKCYKIQPDGVPYTIGLDEEGNFYNGIFMQQVKYLHQLQNLHFALTGTELIISL